MASRRFFDRSAPARPARRAGPRPRSTSRRAARARRGRGCATSSPSCLQLHDTMTQRAEAAAVADAYIALSDDGRHNFLRMLARDFWTDPRRSTTRSPRSRARRRTAATVGTRTAPARRARCRPPDRLLRLFTGLEGGVKFLVDLRADVLRVASATPTLGRPRPRAQGAARDAVRRRAAHAAAHHVGGARGTAREADRVRGGARDQLVGRPEEPARLRSALLRVLPPGDARRAARVRRDRAHRRHRDRAARRCSTRARPTSTSNGPTRQSSTRSPTASPGSRASTWAPRSIKQVVEALRLDLPQLRRFVTLSPIPGFRTVGRARARRRRRRRCAPASASCLPAEPGRVLGPAVRPRTGTSTRRSGPRCWRCARAT